MTTYERMIQVFEAVFEDSINTDNITEESALIEDVGISSVGMLYMALALEEEFKIKFENSDFPTLRTVGDVKACIEKKL